MVSYNRLNAYNDRSSEEEKNMSLQQVPAGRNFPDDINSVEDLDEILLDQIVHFFDHYKDLETGKWVDINGWE